MAGHRSPIAAGAVAALALLPASALADGPQQIGAFRAPAVTPVGERTIVAGHVSPAGRAEVVIERRRADYTWEAIATLRADPRGRFRAELPLRGSARLRAALRLPDGTLAPGSGRRQVAVRRRAELSVSVDPTEAIAGRPIAVRGRVWPARPGESARVEGRRGKRWMKVGALRVKPGGRVAGAVRLPGGGEWSLRLVAPGRKGLDRAGASRRRALTVFGANPHGTPKVANYIVQDLGETRLYYYEDGRLRRVLPVVFGKPSTPTPLGSYRVYSKTTGPGAAFGPLVLWYHRGYGIHGTNQEYLLDDASRYYSHGCTRNYNVNILWLWPRVPIGTPVVNIS